MRDAWERGQKLSIHGWFYGLKDKLIRNLNFTVSSSVGSETAYHTALSELDG